MQSLDRFSEPALFILISLAEGEKHGYAIMEDIEQQYHKKLSPGTLYGAISRMEKLELIEAMPLQNRRKPYKITSTGKAYLEESLKELEQVTTLGRRRLGLL
ncbi:PadR family transcriptional regulator [Oceanobacillus manasiensis]|uniref:PadR family transcriptional regulator n=1 Tax=Oceanobacillus manasiensis TaxID=586413 RepID=UPI0005A813D1|nr:PadR family transcriptional regulator [Oceanobacillus manasiensis]